MKSAVQLARLSTLLDEALDLDEAGRAAWLAALAETDAPLSQTLRRLLEAHVSRETGDLLDAGPVLTGLAGTDAEDSAFSAGQQVGPYLLEREIGRGGMGEVWLAAREDGQLKRRVALKLPLLNARRSVLVQRFARERDILGSLSHPNIARLYDAGLDTSGQPYLALEYVEGQAITSYCTQHALDSSARVELLRQVLGAVQYAHANLVIHRDLKPSNVLVTEDGQAMLLDFGIAKLLQDDQAEASETELTRIGGRALTLSYAAPEQISGAPVSTATDVYALGALMFELLVGQRPFTGNRQEIERAILADEPPYPAMLPSDMATIVLKALKKRPEERYATADALSADLGRWLRHEAVLAQPDRWLYRSRKFVRRHRLAVLAGAVTTLAVLTASGVAVWQAVEARRQAQRAQAVQSFLTDIFQANSDHSPDPEKARATTARQLLDIGAQRLGTALKDAPEARLEVMGTLGDMYYELQLDQEALVIDRQRVALMRQLYGPDDERLAEGLVHLAGSLHSSPHRDEIIPALEEARRILEHRGDPSSTVRGQMLSRLAQRYFNVSLVKSRDYGDEAVRFWQARNGRSPDHLSAALILSGRTRVALGELATARQAFQSAIEVITSMPNVPQFSLMEARISLAEVLELQQEHAAALALAQKASAEGAQALGPLSPGVIAARARFAGLLHRHGQRAESRLRFDAALADVLAVNGPDDTLYTPLVRRLYARALADEGRPAEALQQLQLGRALDRIHYAGSLLLARTLDSEAVLLDVLGQPDAAWSLLGESQAIQSVAGEGMQAWRGNRLRLDAARVALSRSKPQEALDRLSTVVAPAPADSPSPHPDLIERDLVASYARLQAGQPEAAMSEARRAVEALPALRARGRLPGLEADVRMAHAAALMAAGHAGEACAAAEEARTLRREADDDPASPSLLPIDAMLGRCRLAQGDRVAAREALHRTEAVARHHEALARRFTAPVAELRRSLSEPALR
ncbi:MAG: serine/threonine-protein kinase [Caldimonas sp.]